MFFAMGVGLGILAVRHKDRIKQELKDGKSKAKAKS